MPTLYEKKNPTTIPGFVNVDKTITLPNGEKKQVTIKRPKPGMGFDILTDEVLSNNNLDVLNKFAEENKDELEKPENAPAKRYIKARIRTEKKFRKLRADAKQKAALGVAPKKPELDEKDGFIGLASVKYPDYQTSSNGCWSISYSALLMSRGVDLSQEEIRQWRPDYDENLSDDLKPSEERMILMNTDDINSIYQNADLALRVLPNTAVNTFKLEPFSEQQLSIDDKQLEDFQVDAAAEAYNYQVKRQLQDTISEALVVHRSPIAVALDGHYVTITGISEDGNTIRYEDSRGAEKNSPRTNTMSLDELIHNGLYLHEHKGEKVMPTGIEITWLSDLPQAHYADPQKPLMSNKHGDYVKMGDDGSIKISIPDDVSGLSESGKSADGQMNGKAVDEMMLLDSKELSEALGGQKVTGWGPGGKVMIGSKSTYYPKNTVQLGDPKLVKKAYSNGIKAFEAAYDTISKRIFTEDALKELKEYRKLLRAVSNDDITPEEKKEKIAGLKGFYDLLTKKDKEGDKCNFEVITSDLNDKARKELIEQLKKVNDLFGLGRDADIKRFREIHEDLAEAYKREKEKAKEESLGIAFKQSVRSAFVKTLEIAKEKYDNLGENEYGDMRLAVIESSDEAIENNLAYVAAAWVLQKRMLDNNINPPYPDKEEVYALVPKMKESEAFKMTLNGSRAWLENPRKSRDWTYNEQEYCMQEFLREYTENAKAFELDDQDLARYEIPEWKKPEIKMKTAGIADRLERTGTGSYTGLGIISRRKNSDAFDKVKKAIRNYSKKKSPSAGDTRKACKTVLGYLEGKSRVRTRAFGRTRFNECMSFLSLVMPEAEFAEYCRQINASRGVSAGHEKFIGPESFLTPDTTCNDVINSAREKINAGSAGDRDYARLIACADISVINGEVDLTQSCASKEKKQALLTKTESVLADPRFKNFMSSMSKDVMNALVNADATAVGDAWAQYKNVHSLEEAAAVF